MLQSLPQHLAERIEPSPSPPHRDGELVIYWMRVAVRARENPALDVALAAGAALGKPVFVYHALAQGHPYASDRLHTFILEGARDVSRDLAERGIAYAFHLERPGGPTRVLERLASRAALIVTDFMPVEPLSSWDRTVARLAPLWRVDASCIAPVWLLTKPCDGAFTFRAQAEPLWRARLGRSWHDLEPATPTPLPADLPFDPVDLEADLDELVAACDIDHTIAPVRHTQGGSVAARTRWRVFADSKLAHYARDRNDPLRDGNSRVSAYLHFGHLSPFGVAREAQAIGGEGADKFLDELLTWRELAWHFCWHEPRHGEIEALPAWARESLREHERDPRPSLPSWDELARARTGDALWDACQRSLLTHGELHNNTRMTWGKALLGWTRNAREALAILIDLNHRYALDGRDPSSYGGILWCLGAFDRPFPPAQPVTGVVRSRPTDQHARRLDVAAYTRRVARPTRASALQVAIVGAGVAGAAAARAIADAGRGRTRCRRGRGPGGRLSTRRYGEVAFDHGAQYFTVRDERFARVARAFWHEGLLAEWKGAVPVIGPLTEAARRVSEGKDARVVATPGMSALIERMLAGAATRFATPVERIVRDSDALRLHGAQEAPLGRYDAVVVAVPAPQAATLVAPVSQELASRIEAARMDPCWAAMLHFDAALGVSWPAAVSTTGPLAWLANDTSKPGRPGAGESWVLHASPEWSRAHLEEPAEEVLRLLLEAFFTTTALPPRAPAFARAHRWRYARTAVALGEPCLWDPAARLAVCGDWCLGARVEAAFLSGSAAAGRINGLPG